MESASVESIVDDTQVVEFYLKGDLYTDTLRINPPEFVAGKVLCDIQYDRRGAYNHHTVVSYTYEMINEKGESPLLDYLRLFVSGLKFATNYTKGFGIEIPTMPYLYFKNHEDLSTNIETVLVMIRENKIFSNDEQIMKQMIDFKNKTK